MTLGFKQTIDNKPTYFVYKICNGYVEQLKKEEKYYKVFLLVLYFIANYRKYKRDFGKEIDLNTKRPQTIKIHTIRKDEKKRWKVGSKIHFVINNRTKTRFEFAPTDTVKAIQKIKIRRIAGLQYGGNIWVDNRYLNLDEIQKLAWNDGFDSVEDFWAYFDNDFDGIIIHWFENTCY